MAVFGQQIYYEVLKIISAPTRVYWLVLASRNIKVLRTSKMFNFVGQFWEPLFGNFGNTQIFTGTALSIRRGNLGLVATPSQIASAHRKI